MRTTENDPVVNGMIHPVNWLTGDRIFWILLRRFWSGWERSLLLVKPETVIAWHRQGFKLFRGRRSMRGRVGRPRIPRKHAALIRPEWGEDKIAEEFDAKFGIHHSASTIRRYMVQRFDGPRKTQTWHTVI